MEKDLKELNLKLSSLQFLDTINIQKTITS